MGYKNVVAEIYPAKYCTKPLNTFAPSKNPNGIILKINKNPLMNRVAASICIALVLILNGWNLIILQQLNHISKFKNGPAKAIAADSNGVAAPLCVTYPGTKKIKPVLRSFMTTPNVSQKYAA